MSKTNIPVNKPYRRKKLDRYIDGIYERNWLTNSGLLVRNSYHKHLKGKVTFQQVSSAATHNFGYTPIVKALHPDDIFIQP